MENVEIRSCELSEIRAEEDGGQQVIRGYAAAYNKDSRDLGGFVESIMPGAFDSSLAAGDDVVALFNHDQNHVLGRRSAKTMTVTSDSTGLAVKIIPPDTQMARDMIVGIKRGDISKMSFAFRVPPGGAEWRDGGKKRILKKVELRDVSVATNPAYPDTSVGMAMRSAEMALQEAEESRKRGPALRLNEIGFAFAKDLIGKGDVSDKDWSFDAADGDILLGEKKEDWAAYSSVHLAIEPEATDKTKAYYGYPFAKKVGDRIILFTSAIHAIRSRSAANGSAHIFEAAGVLEKLLAEKTEKKSAPLDVTEAMLRIEMARVI